eukprot:contig_21307_g5236
MGAVHAVEASASAHAVAGKATTAGRTGGATPSHGDRDNSTGAEAKSLPWYAATVPVDDLGVRVFPPAPSPGVHPRVLCTAAEVPAFMAAIHHTPFGAAVSAPILQAALKEFRAYAARLLAAIPPCDREHPPATASNWATYHGHLALFCSAIEGEGTPEDEDMLDVNVDTLFSQLTADYVEYAIHDSGHPIEDAYAVNLGFREGSFALLALARRGTNLFRHSKYLALWQQVLPHLLEPRPGGVTGLLGGSSGNAWQYLTSVVVAKWVMPREPLVDWAYALLSGATRVAGDSGTVVYPGLKAKWQ